MVKLLNLGLDSIRERNQKAQIKKAKKKKNRTEKCGFKKGKLQKPCSTEEQARHPPSPSLRRRRQR